MPEVVPGMHPSMLAHDVTAFQPQLGRSVTIDQAAQLLGMSRRTVYYRIREGRLRTIRTLGGSQRVLVESLQEQRHG
jgi:excisionase family DNA binding protein